MARAKCRVASVAARFAFVAFIVAAGAYGIHGAHGAQAAAGQVARLLDPIPPGRAAQGFSLPDVHGRRHTLEEYRGRFVLVAFWSANCLICVEEIADMEAMYHLLRGGDADAALEIVAIHAGAGSSKMHEVLAASPTSYTVLVDEELAMGGWGIPALPTVYLVNPKGELLYRAVGARDWGAPRLLNLLRSITGAAAKQ